MNEVFPFEKLIVMNQHAVKNGWKRLKSNWLQFQIWHDKKRIHINEIQL